MGDHMSGDRGNEQTLCFAITWAVMRIDGLELRNQGRAKDWAFGAGCINWND